jgi:hypothetical protein
MLVRSKTARERLDMTAKEWERFISKRPHLILKAEGTHPRFNLDDLLNEFKPKVW